MEGRDVRREGGKGERGREGGGKGGGQITSNRCTNMYYKTNYTTQKVHIFQTDAELWEPLPLLCCVFTTNGALEGLNGRLTSKVEKLLQKCQ